MSGNFPGPPALRGWSGENFGVVPAAVLEEAVPVARGGVVDIVVGWFLGVSLDGGEDVSRCLGLR